jgi:hypothetical protein
MTTTARTQQLFQVSTLYGAATLAAALDAGLFGPRGTTRRVLVVSNNSATPETATRLPGMLGFDRIATRFDEVIDWNDAIRPHHPSDWSPRPDESPLWERLFRSAWRLGTAPVELAVKSVHVSPAKALTTIFADSAVHVYADGLMSYGPTRDRLPRSIGCRIRRLLHLDLVPGLRPMLLSEHAVEPEIVPDGAFVRVLGELGEDAAGDTGLARAARDRPTAVLLGQYLAALGILTAEEEEELHARMLRAAVSAGHTCVLFKPHPSAPARYSTTLERAAEDAGVALNVLDGPVLAEAVYERCKPDLVVGCFSTAMLTAAAHYRVPVARVGTGLLLERLTPYENSNRVPVTLVDRLVPDLEQGQEPTSDITATGDTDESGGVGALVRTVGFCMQAGLHPALRTEAEAWLTAHLNADTARYFKRRRLSALALPGGGPSVRGGRLRSSPAARRVARKVRAVRRAVR